MAEIAKFNSRLVMKHDSSTNWEKATNFKPLAGELIIYDDVKDMKIGDGATLVNDLSFPFAKRSNGVYYVAGNTSGTAGTWTGTSEEIKNYYDGLVVAYKIGVAGASTTTLNINNLGAKVCYLRGTTQLTTHYAVNNIVLLVYTTVDGTGRWYATADYDSNSDTKVTQAYRTNNENRPLLMSAGYTIENTSGSTATTSYWNPKIYGNPNSGALSASTLYEGTTKLADKYLSLTGGTLSGDLTLMASNQHNQDMFIKFKYSTTDLDDYSWRLGYLGTGEGNTNYFVIQSNGSGDAWKSVMQLGLSNHDATFAGSLTAASLNTSGTITGKGSSITELNASNISSGTLAAARLSTSGVTAGTYGTAQTPAHGGTFAIPTVTVDKYGRITSAGTVNITLPADNNTDTKVQQNKVTDTVWRKVLLSYNSGTAIDSTPSNATNISYWAAGIEVQPSTGIIKTEGYNIGGDATMSYDSTNACIRFTFS